MRGRARFGRGGRLIFDRVDPITREPFAEAPKFAPTRRALQPLALHPLPLPLPAPAELSAPAKQDGPAAPQANGTAPSAMEVDA